MAQLTGLQNVLITTIFLAPLSKSELRQVIWSRHKTGGLLLEYGDLGEAELKEKVIENLMSRLHNQTGGKPGWALVKWLTAITDYNEGNIKMEMPEATEFPVIDHSGWKGMLLQFILHRMLSKNQLYKMYEGEEKEWINQMIRELKRSGILKEPVKGVFIIPVEIRPYVEDWLKEMEVL